MLGIFLDIETTGLDATRHHPIDIALKVIDLTTGDLKGEYQSIIKHSPESWASRDLSSVAFNGFSWEDVLSGKEVSVIREEVMALFSALKIQRGSACFICQNPAFDRAFFNQLVEVYKQEELNWPYHWLDLASMYWTVRVAQAKDAGQSAPEKVALSKNEIARYYNIPIESTPHRAIKGVEHLITCYQAVLQQNFSGEN